ncbi:hypothetical protein ACIA5D_40685 [Actinoplanes sp. NPDC051513]|uniref:hypothetical protein n=1 Tax=Actinoplanes sp. NPDC051513 TaxID=3363908 RepID=UPI0037884A14
MSVQLNRLLEHVLDGEPELGDEIDAVFRRADRLRRRRTRVLVAAGVAAVAVIVATGYALTTALMPTTAGSTPVAAPSSAPPLPSAVADPVLALIAPIVDGGKLHIYPRPPERGSGWRQYSVVDKDGKPRGTVEVAVYSVAEDLCFPVLAAPGKCAHTEWAPAGIEYVRYDDDRDLDWQVHQTIARRITDGRTVAVMATGERGADNAPWGKPGLTGAQIEQVATDRRLFNAFGAAEQCSGPSSGACPAFKVPVPLPAD